SVMNGSQQHGIGRLDVPIREQPGVFVPVRIGRDSWIGERAIIAADVGQHCVIGAGSVVTKPIPDFAVAVGVPAKVLRFRKVDDTVEKDLRPSVIGHRPSAVSTLNPQPSTLNF
ncbi:MAG: O-acetyltransferase, partial [Planctomycetota bacterium]